MSVAEQPVQRGKPLTRLSTLFALAAAFFIVSTILIVQYWSAQTRDHVGHHLEQMTARQEVAWDASLRMYRNTSEFWFEQYLITPATLNLVRQALVPEQREAARSALYAQLSEIYGKMQIRGIDQLHFHLPDGTSLLRFHNPKLYGDSLFDFRHTLRHVNEQLEPIFGFEAGRHVSGFRSVFPLVDGGEHLGSVEISLPFTLVQEAISELIDESQFELIIHRDALRELLGDQQSQFEQWHGSDDFFIHSSAANRLSEESLLWPRMLADPQLQQVLRGGISGSIGHEYNNLYYVATMTAATNIFGEKIGFVVGVHQDPVLDMYYAEFKRNVMTSLLLLVVVTVFLWVFVRARQVHGIARTNYEQQLLKSNERFHQLADQSRTFEWEIDRDGLYTYLSPTVEKVLGYRPEEMIGKMHFYDIVPLSVRDQFKAESLGLIAKKETVTNLENPAQHKNGNLVWLNTNTIPLLDARGGLVGYRGNDSDISVRKQAQHVLQHKTTELIRANAELVRLGEVMTHHFQEPTRRLVSFARHLQEKEEMVGDDDSRQVLRFIDSQSQRLSDLVRDIQRYLTLDDIYKTDRSDPLADSSVILRAVIAEIDIADADIVIHEPLPQVALAAAKLRQMFFALLDNASVYRHPQRSLRIEVEAATENHQARFRFSDNGSGIAPQYRAQVLDLFTRLVPNSIPGTGMGLALVRRIVHQVAGSIAIEDGLDGGISIVLTLPLEAPNEQPETTHSPVG